MIRLGGAEVEGAVPDAQRETIRLVNRTIREFADDPRVSDGEKWEFFCECGCFTLVELTIAEYDAVETVRAPGHGVGEMAASD